MKLTVLGIVVAALAIDALLPAIARGEDPIQLPRDETILAEIQRTGFLKVAIRRDAAPFGYINEAGVLEGYCRDIADALRGQLSASLDRVLGLRLVELPSTLETRFSLVQDNIAHLECGPNTIRQDIEGIRFSDPNYVAGSYFLIPRPSGSLSEEPLDPNSSLADVRIGVLRNTTTEQFLSTTYPNANLVRFQGINGRIDGVICVSDGSIDAFVSEGVLTASVIAQQNLSLQNYAFIPNQPLTCDFYGLILPGDDPEWQETINGFLASDAEEAIWSHWFGDVAPHVTDIYHYCTNR